ncbi:MAG: hypothetical protein ACQKBV_05220 [Puniceicoccales bacterium]
MSLIARLLPFFLLAFSAALTHAQNARTVLLINDLTAGQHAALASAMREQLTEKLTADGFTVLSPQETESKDESFDERPLQMGSTVGTLEIAQSVQADYVIVVNLITYGPKQLHYESRDPVPAGVVYALRLSYDLLAVRGTTPLTGDEIRLTETFLEDKPASYVAGDLATRFVDQASTQIASEAQTQTGVLPRPATTTGSVSTPSLSTPSNAPRIRFSVTPHLSDITLPNISLTADNQVSIGADELPVIVRGVAVTLDGVLVGHAPGNFPASAGLHRLQLSGYGLLDWEEAVELSDGDALTPELSLSADGLADYYRVSDFINALQDGDTLTPEQSSELRASVDKLLAAYAVDFAEIEANQQSLWARPATNGEE